MTAGWTLMAKSRSLLPAAAGCGLASVLTYLVGGQLFPVRYGSTDVPYAALLPLICACCIGVSTRAQFDEWERSAAISASLLRAVALAAILLVSVVGVGVAAAMLPEPVSAAASLRNLLGLTGLALLTSSVTGSGTSWVLPLAYVVAAVTLSVGNDYPLWAWLLRPGSDKDALLVAVVLGVVGAALVTVRGTREPARER